MNRNEAKTYFGEFMKPLQEGIEAAIARFGELHSDEMHIVNGRWQGSEIGARAVAEIAERLSSQVDIAVLGRQNRTVLQIDRQLFLCPKKIQSRTALPAYNRTPGTTDFERGLWPIGGSALPAYYLCYVLNDSGQLDALQIAKPLGVESGELEWRIDVIAENTHQIDWVDDTGTLEPARVQARSAGKVSPQDAASNGR